MSKRQKNSPACVHNVMYLMLENKQVDRKNILAPKSAPRRHTRTGPKAGTAAVMSGRRLYFIKLLLQLALCRVAALKRFPVHHP